MKKLNNNKIWIRLINSLLAGALIFLGAFLDGEISAKEIIIAGAGGLIAAITQFRNFLKTKEKQYKSTLFCFIK